MQTRNELPGLGFETIGKDKNSIGILAEIDNSVEWRMLIHSQHLRMQGKMYKGNDGNKDKTPQTKGETPR